METAQLRFEHQLKAAGHSLTRARRLVFRYLEGSEAQSLHALIERAKGQIDRASVYRAITLFERLGIVQRVPQGWKYKIELTDRFSPHHHHLVCSRCHALISTADDPALEQAITNLARRHGFTGVTHQLEIAGVCANCQRATNAVPGRTKH